MLRKISYKFCQQAKSASSNNLLQFFYENHTLKLRQPCFQVYSGQIDILHDPIDFYIHLHKGIKMAGERIILSTLYIGTGNLEKYLVASINNKVKRSKKLKVKVLQDFCRGTRMNRKNESSKTMVEQLKTENLHNNNVKLAFYRNPDVNRLVSLDTDSGLREIFGVHHMKCYIFDNDVILSGANLSENYFTERQDRYFYIRNAAQLANYMEDALDVVINNSFQVGDQGELHMFNSQPNHGKKFKDVFNNQFKMFLFSHRLQLKEKGNYERFFNQQDEPKKQNNDQKPSSDNKANDQQQKGTVDDKEKLKDVIPKYFKDNTDIQQYYEEKKQQAKVILEKSFNETEVFNIVRRIDAALYQDKPRGGELEDLGGKVYIFPTIQIPALNYNEDRKLFINFLKEILSKDKNLVKIASGYMSFLDEVTEQIIQAKSKVELLTASPRANGFYQGGLFKQWIPYFYRLFEYQKGQWTFHSKGLWFYQDGEEHPSGCVIGSSNYSYRSYGRDTEMNFYMYTVCPKFKADLHLENTKQFSSSQNVTELNLKKDPEMKFSFVTVLLGKLMKSFL